MGWVKGAVMVAGMLAATAAPPYVPPGVAGSTRGLRLGPTVAFAKAHGGGSSSPAEAGVQEGQAQGQGGRRQQVIVTPQIRVFEGDRAQLGVSLRDLDEASAKEHKLAAPDGALVDRVEPDSPAEKAGVKSGDVIVSFDGERVRSARQLQRLVGETPPDRVVKIGLVRDGKRVEVSAALAKSSGSVLLPGRDDLRLGELDRNLDRLRDLPRAFPFEWRDDQAPGDTLPRWDPRWPSGPLSPNAPFPLLPGLPRYPFNGWTSGAGRLGIVAQDLTPQLGDYFGSRDGVLVASVADGSPAAHAGIKAGDVITAVDGKAVNNVDDLLRAVRAQPDGQEMTVGVVRDHKAQTLKVKLLSATKARPI
jgi:serine protease Do